MRRRDVISLLGGAAAVWPLAAWAQQAIPVVGFLGSRSPGDSENLVAAFRAGLGESGFVEDRNVMIEFRWAEGHYDRLAAAGGRSGAAGKWLCWLRREASPLGSLPRRRPRKYRSSFVTGTDPVASRSGHQPQPPRRQSHRGRHPHQTLWRQSSWSCCTRWCRRVTLVSVFSSTRKIRSLKASTRDLHSAANTTRQQILCPPCQQRKRDRKRIRELWCNSAPERCSFRAIRFSTAGLVKSLRSPPAMRYRRYINGATFRRPAA